MSDPSPRLRLLRVGVRGQPIDAGAVSSRSRRDAPRSRDTDCDDIGAGRSDASDNPPKTGKEASTSPAPFTALEEAQMIEDDRGLPLGWEGIEVVEP